MYYYYYQPPKPPQPRQLSWEECGQVYDFLRRELPCRHIPYDIGHKMEARYHELVTALPTAQCRMMSEVNALAFVERYLFTPDKRLERLCVYRSDMDYCLTVKRGMLEYVKQFPVYDPAQEEGEKYPSPPFREILHASELRLLLSDRLDIVDDYYLFLLEDVGATTRDYLTNVSIDAFIDDYLYEPDTALRKLCNGNPASYEEACGVKAKMTQFVNDLLHERYYDSHDYHIPKPLGAFYNTTEALLGRANSFRRKHGYCPMLYVLMKSYCEPENGSVNRQIYASLQGIGRDKPMKMKAAMAKYGMSEKALKNIVQEQDAYFVNGIFSRDKFSAQMVQTYLKDGDFFTEDHPVFTECQTIERASYHKPFLMKAFSVLSCDYYVLFHSPAMRRVHLHNTPHTYLVRSELNEALDLQAWYEYFWKIYSLNTTARTVGLLQLIRDSKLCSTRNEETISRLAALLAFMLERDLGLRVDEEGNILLPRTKRAGDIIITDSVREILAESGKPMTLDQMFRAFKRRYPDHPYRNASQLRPLIGYCPEVHSIYPAVYALKIWGYQPFSELPKAVERYLGSITRPASVERILQHIGNSFPMASPTSVTHALQRNLKGRIATYQLKDAPPEKHEKLYTLVDKQVNVNKYEPFQYVPALPPQMQRDSFSIHFPELCRFVESHGRYPFGCFKEEAALNLWWNEARNGNRILSPEQQQQLAQFEQEHPSAIRSRNEQLWHNNMHELLRYIEENHRTPLMKSKLMESYRESSSLYTNTPVGEALYRQVTQAIESLSKG